MRLDLGACVVRSWRRDDASSLIRHANDPRISANMRDRFPHPYTADDAANWVAFATGANPETNFAIEVGGEAVGGIGLELHSDIERVAAEIGYWLGSTFWGRGVATAAVRGFTRYALTAFPLTRLYATVFSENVASARVLEKVGYHCEGVLRRAAIKQGRVLDLVLYAVTDEDVLGAAHV